MAARTTASIGSGEKTSATETRNDGRGSTAVTGLEATATTDGRAAMSVQSADQVVTIGRITTNVDVDAVHCRVFLWLWKLSGWLSVIFCDGSSFFSVYEAMTVVSSSIPDDDGRMMCISDAGAPKNTS